MARPQTQRRGDGFRNHQSRQRNWAWNLRHVRYARRRHGGRLQKAGLDYYNHNLDTDPERYNDIIHTRKHEDRMDTLGKVRNAGLKVCCGGIVGMNETRAERRRTDCQPRQPRPAARSVPY